MRPFGLVAAVASGVFLLSTAAAYADGWTAARLRGEVLVSRQGKWVALKLNDTISGGQPVKTSATGAVQFERNGETVDVFANTQIAIEESAAGSVTTVKEDFGTVTVQDNETAVPRFSVVTPYLVSVVKGTIFTVSTLSGHSRVSVARGKVEVDDIKSRSRVLLLPGQFAAGGVDMPLTTGGTGTVQPILNPAGEVVGSAKAAGGQAHAADGAGNSSNGNAVGNGNAGGGGGAGGSGNAGGSSNAGGGARSGGNGNGN